jgi:hypothetical protein
MDLGVVNLLDDAGGIIAQLDLSNGSDYMSVPVDAGEVVGLEIQPADGWAPGANDFYAIVMTAGSTDYEPEDDTTDLSDGGVGTGGNDIPEGASPVPTWEAVTTGQRVSVMGFIDPITDTDYFEFTAEAGETIALGCWAARSGSGLDDANFAIHDADDVMLQNETETDGVDINWGDYAGASKPAVPVDATGTFYLVVTAGAQDPDVSSNFYRCILVRVAAAK